MLPIIFIEKPGVNNFYSIKFQTANVPHTIHEVEKVWNAHFGESPFSYFFLDDLFDAQYKSGARFGRVFGMFALLAIIIACFGLLSLSAYNVLQRTKEIGIRKVLGASVQNIIYLLSKEFLILVCIAFVVSVPVAWWVMHTWLQDFAYRITIAWWIFGVAGVIAFVIALSTVSFQAVKAALLNPVKSLRIE
jgi:putative ABC transport system permease protein